ncbi:hypothetical protein B0T26DRAFT_633682 [Lasiosphaeria miniovina]|uniref:Pyridoxamine 5'-phosphate oxidase N-terminal domain-containing protein n=1 Tax=Lasiosphaeria miniovina TaxID=1954250 RepID=A0AA40BGC3_9PEZI|nr:uncharacterized protein B0T26DRAFT_633682 [Lasiosphaeria miniovina]KAK0733742.1 hypothetical protein B0T26DRAFT_633682 [Lasiosphaeria miniovina]
MEQQIPLNHEASAGDTNMQVTPEMPAEVVQCLSNARFLHLATCFENIPHVSLMNYTYLPSSPYSGSDPVIVMTTNPASKKTNNLVANPNVSLLVHDWVSHRPSTTQRRLSGGSFPGPENPSPLATLLFNLNATEMSSISATITGSARLVDSGSEEERYFREKHLQNNTFDASSSLNLVGDQAQEEGDGGRGHFVAGEEVRVIVVAIRHVRIADWKGSVRDWVISPPASAPGVPVSQLLNGIH